MKSKCEKFSKASITFFYMSLKVVLKMSSSLFSDVLHKAEILRQSRKLDDHFIKFTNLFPYDIFDLLLR